MSFLRCGQPDQDSVPVFQPRRRRRRLRVVRIEELRELQIAKSRNKSAIFNIHYKEYVGGGERGEVAILCNDGATAATEIHANF